ncbi:hypothetical protein [Vreelandella venusta]|uniref:hypothetical protein n=1 Tax=Vreelandella venusta TaxID=44935 RepID=UPI00200C652B|nr:hypothetical protein [Halomonas venusta]UQI40030.1 hypothetical protein M3L73_17745 [Halomonas venusta]
MIFATLPPRRLSVAWFRAIAFLGTSRGGLGGAGVEQDVIGAVDVYLGAGLDVDFIGVEIG